MKKSLKRAISLVLCTAVASSLAACNGNNSTQQKGGLTTVTVWTGNGHDKAFLDRKINEWNETVGKENNIRIDYTVQDKVGDKLTLAFESDQAPDLFPLANFYQNVELGRITAYDDVEGLEDLVEHYGKFAMYGRQKYKDGKVYSLPKSTTTYGIIYNKDMFKEAGLVDENGEPTPPKTYAEYREYAKKLTNPSKKEYGVIFPGKFGGWYSDDIMSFASASTGMVDGYDPTKGEYNYWGDAQAMKLIMQIKEDGSYYPGVEGLDNDPARARFASGGVGMKTAASYDFGVLTDQFPATIDWGVAPYPVVDEDHIGGQFMSSSSYLAINSKSIEEKKDAIVKVLHFFYGDELVIDAYKEGIDLPVDWELVKDIKLDESKKQWQEFAELVSISHSNPLPVASDTEDVTDIRTTWINEIWPGNIGIDEIDAYCEEFTNIKNAGIPVYQEKHENYDPSPYIIPDFKLGRN